MMMAKNNTIFDAEIGQILISGCFDWYTHGHSSGGTSMMDSYFSPPELAIPQAGLNGVRNTGCPPN
jgi:hypothetical protein